ncbi:MAG: 2-amino-4-hydroxy-6-hydroxymethyldihydropteridine diphosphokinase [Dysgonamonadaceae bacterium]|nr:2-amino-4-hydroxy-6-hydroxymethyldihydropteridine diphosphokinase [Dysgonamonadaceae bacterium]MDD4728135.1 2-amino-4-hydroxy-6-hydroxymethyldihydropteridine diphosphokinase [Dysgonamonadaceae bacterium]
MDSINNTKDCIVFHTVYLGLGTNLGNKENNIELALMKIEKQIGNIFSSSAFYVSEPFGFESDNLFINCAIGIKTVYSPLEVFYKTQLIEEKMGRIHNTDLAGYSDRVIDIDILLYDNLIINDKPNLTIPHSKMHERDFVLKPLSEIAPHVIHPVLNKTILHLLKTI